MTRMEHQVNSEDISTVNQMRDSNKSLASIIKCEDMIEDLNPYLSFKNSAAVHFYPTQIETIMDLLIDMKTMVFEYSEAFEKLQDMLEEEQGKNAKWDDLFKPQS